MEKIIIKPSNNADSRTSDKNRKISFEEFMESTESHRNDVKRTMESFANEIIQRGKDHDWTKISRAREFFTQFTLAKEQGVDFKDSDWYKYHTTEERHHLNTRVPNDINLIDIIEYLCDCICAGYARSGDVYHIDITNDDLRKAYENTQEMIKNNVILDKGENNGMG